MNRFISILAVVLTAQISFAQTVSIARPERTAHSNSLYRSVLENYRSTADGITLAEIVKRAVASSGEIAVARLEAEKAEARLVQARQRPNPTLSFEHGSGGIVGSRGDSEFSVGVSVPLEAFGQRGGRIGAARAEIALRRAEVAAKERAVTTQVMTAYLDALVTLREIEILEEVLDLDEETVRFVQIRVNEGETPPLELNLLQAEVERIRARRLLTEGKLQAAISRLKFFSAIPDHEPLRLTEDISTAALQPLPNDVPAAVELALNERPEMRILKLEEELAEAEMRSAAARSKPDVNANAKYAQGRSAFDDPRGPFVQKDRSLTFGVSIGIPVFDRGQGAKAEAAISIRQAQERRLFAERVIKNEITTSFQRIEAADRALTAFKTGVLPRSRENVETVRRVYEIGGLKITDLIAEQRKLLEANGDLIEILTEKYRAQADLFLAAGLSMEK